jgi:ribosomal protein S14
MEIKKSEVGLSQEDKLSLEKKNKKNQEIVIHRYCDGCGDESYFINKAGLCPQCVNHPRP